MASRRPCNDDAQAALTVREHRCLLARGSAEGWPVTKDDTLSYFSGGRGVDTSSSTRATTCPLQSGRDQSQRAAQAGFLVGIPLPAASRDSELAHRSLIFHSPNHSSMLTVSVSSVGAVDLPPPMAVQSAVQSTTRNSSMSGRGRGRGGGGRGGARGSKVRPSLVTIHHKTNKSLSDRFAALKKKQATAAKDARAAQQAAGNKATRKEKVSAARAKTAAGKAVAKGEAAKGKAAKGKPAVAGKKKKTQAELDAEMDQFLRKQEGGLDRELDAWMAQKKEQVTKAKEAPEAAPAGEKTDAAAEPAAAAAEADA